MFRARYYNETKIHKNLAELSNTLYYIYFQCTKQSRSAVFEPNSNNGNCIDVALIKMAALCLNQNIHWDYSSYRCIQ